jgi:hypothetical protein
MRKVNPAHLDARLERRWAAIETQFGQPVRALLIEMREQGYSWNSIAEKLDVSPRTLKNWVNKLQLHDGRHSYISNAKARALGYDSIEDAIRDCRRTMTCRRTAVYLGICCQTIANHVRPLPRSKSNRDTGDTETTQHAPAFGVD